MKQRCHDVECFKKSWDLEEPAPDADTASYFDRIHDQWASDVAVWESSGHDLAAVQANRPRLEVKPIFGCEGIPHRRTRLHRARHTSPRRYHLILLAKDEDGLRTTWCSAVSEAAVPRADVLHAARATLDNAARRTTPGA